MSKKIYLFATSKNENAISVKSLDVRYLKPDIDFSKYDHLIITSKQTIEALKQYEKSDFIDIGAICVSEKTANAYKKFGGKVVMVGDGYGDSLYGRIKELPKSSKMLYLRANIIVSDFVQRCKEEGYDIDEEILYVSECSKEILDIRVNDDSTLIFTSPSSIECFLKNISETHIELQSIRLALNHHNAYEKNALKRRPLFFHPLKRRADYPISYLLIKLFVYQRGRRVCPHAACVWPFVVIF